MVCSKCGNNEELSREDYTVIMADLAKMASPLEMARHAQSCKICSMFLNMANAIVNQHMKDQSK